MTRALTGRGVNKKLFVVVAFVCGAALGGYWWFFTDREVAPMVLGYKTPAEADPYVRFDMEAYDKILQNYWMDPKNFDMPELFRLSVMKATNATSTTLKTKDRDGVAAMLGETFALATSTDAKKELAKNILIVALYNLQPNGRNGLLSRKEETELRQNVSNIDTSKNLYQNLGVEKGATVAAVEAAFKTKAAALKTATSSEAKAELEQAKYARDVLTNKNTKELYDQAQIEPTVFTRIYNKTLYVYVSKVAPTTLREFALAVDAASTTPGLDSIILDERGNVGGALEFLQHFLGLFIGENQYAFDLFHQGEYQVQRTLQPKFAELDRYTEMAILTDSQTQSTAELTAATMKRYRRAFTVGTPSRGWGTVENTYALDTKIDENESYSLLLVNSLTLRDDNQPIETRGVDPDVDITKPNWKTKLSTYFTSKSLIEALRLHADKPPVR